MAFFPSVATAKLELNSLYRKYVDMFGVSLNNSTVGCHLTRKMVHLPVLLIDRTFFSTGTAIQSIAVSYGALIRRWLLNRTSVVQHTLISRAMNSLSWCGSLPFFVSIGVLMTKLCGCTMIPKHFSGRTLILGHSANLRGESVLVMDNNEFGNGQTFLSSLLGRKRDYVGLALQCICYPACLKVVDIPQKKLSFSRQSGYGVVMTQVQFGGSWRETSNTWHA
ncbi:unnamed protein product [Miscanthus lutarioriparius]|uniref:Uncharacterized protein n=1 Tax=Miscanthus lutarioriparius TaxID=422564 RepID=A0A811SMM7_9POAL|nr:unnamed protein product [Miscanthus lutarioriparius]